MQGFKTLIEFNRFTLVGCLGDVKYFTFINDSGPVSIV